MEDSGLNMLGGAEPLKDAPQGAEAPATSFDLVAGMVDDQDMRGLALWAVKYHLDDLDPLWGGFIAAKVGWSASVAAGAAAQAVQAGVASIPDQIWTGAVRASDEVKGGLIAGGKLFAEAFTRAATDRQAALLAAVDTQQSSILAAANLGAEKIKTAAVSLTSSLDKAVKARTEEGVADFARAAAVAGKAAAQSSMAAQLSRSILAFSAVVLLACAVGAGGFWGYLKITHRMMPPGVTSQSDPLMGGTLVTIPGGGKLEKCPAALCVLYPH